MFGKKKNIEEEKVETVEANQEEHELKFREWFNLKGIRSEIKNVHWLTKKELFQNSAIVVLFTFVMGLFFFGGDAIIAFILKALGMD
ncbi:MAG: preprotein translocase subunit SecE [Faecalibacillus sp.]